MHTLYIPGGFYSQVLCTSYEIKVEVKGSVEKGEKSYTDTFEINAVKVRHLFCFVMAVY